MKKLTIQTAALILFSCTISEDKIDTTLPNCIQEIVNHSSTSEDLKTIRVQEINKELHYWLNTDATHFDGVEYILNSHCDTVCSFCGECIPLNCSKEYDKKWSDVWVK